MKLRSPAAGMPSTAPHAYAYAAGHGLLEVLLALTVATSACAPTSLPADTRTAPLAARFAQDDARRAQQLAPDLYARAERASQDALAATDSAARADHATRAELLLQAAIAEADRITAERSAAATDARAELASEQRAELERERLALEQSAQRELAAQAARAQARVEDAKLVRERAGLTLAAAIALGLDPTRAAAIEHAITQLDRPAAGHAESTAARLAAAERVASEAERALGDARNAHPGPTAAELATLLATATDRGLQPKPSARGVVIGLDAAFTAGSAEPSADGKRLLAALAALARAHPHGPIQLETRATTAANAPAERSDRARAERVRAALVGQTDAQRVVLTPAPADDANGARLQAVFAAYAVSAAAKAAL